MIDLEENANHNFPTIWDTYLSFENMSRRTGEKLDTFITRWKENMTLAQAAGCDYSDTVLACKLLQKANLDEIDAKNVVESIVYCQSEMLNSLLFTLEEYSVEYPDGKLDQLTKNELETDNSKLVKEEFPGELFLISKSGLYTEEDPLEANLKEETSEVSQSYFEFAIEKLVDEHEDETTEADMTKDEDGDYEPDNDDAEETETKKRTTKKTRKKTEHHAIIGNRHYCNACSMSFTQSSSLKKHFMRTHTNERPFKCTYCSYSTVEQSELTRHIRCHTGEKPFKCPTCDKAFPDKKLMKRHFVQVHTDDRPFKCTHCSYSTVYKRCLTLHIRSHTGERPFECITCGKDFADKNYLDRHIMRAHSFERPFKCTECSYSTVQKSELIRHMRCHTGERPFKCQSCEKDFPDKKILKRHFVQAHTNERPFQCTECNFSTVYKKSLTVHIRSHTGERPFKCSVCEKDFTDKQKMEMHFMRMHTLERPHKCPHPDCNFGAVEKGELTHHMRSHTGEKPFKCPMCEKAFADKRSLKYHIKTGHAQGDLDESKLAELGLKLDWDNSNSKIKNDHTTTLKEEMLESAASSEVKSITEVQGFTESQIRKLMIKPSDERWQCEHCGKDFSGRGALRVHYGVCPNLDAEERAAKGYKNVRMKRKFNCEVCNKTLVGQHNYRQHLSLHSNERNFICDICPSTFTSDYYLQLHKQRHRKGKAHHCNSCSKSFHGASGLKKHIMREHTNERPFQCPHCTYSTVENCHLARHIRSHTGETPFKCNLCGKMYRDKKSVKRHVKVHHGQCEANDVITCEVPAEKVVEG